MPGARQRVQAAEEAAADAAHSSDQDYGLGGHADGSCLVALLVGLWSWGLMSPQTVQKICHAALKDLRRASSSELDFKKMISEIDNIAAIGSYGKYSGNCNANLRTRLSDSLSTMRNVQMPVVFLGRAASTGATIANQCMLLPHLLFSVMSNMYPKSFAKLMCPGRQRLREFWSNMSGNPQLEGCTL